MIAQFPVEACALCAQPVAFLERVKWAMRGILEERRAVSVMGADSIGKKHIRGVKPEHNCSSRASFLVQSFTDGRHDGCAPAKGEDASRKSESGFKCTGFCFTPGLFAAVTKHGSDITFRTTLESQIVQIVKDGAESDRKLCAHGAFARCAQSYQDRCGVRRNSHLWSMSPRSTRKVSVLRESLSGH
jgi:hypothetical protein